MKTVQTLTLAIALAMAPAMSPAAAVAEPADALTLGAERRGEITSRSSLNHQDGSRSQLYRIDLREGQVVAFKLEGALRGRLTAFHDGDLVATSNPERESAPLVVRARRAGSYTIAVSGVDASAYGPFTLQATAIEAYNGETLRVGAAISDWTDARRQLPLQIDEAGFYTIDMMSDDFDSVLKLDGPGVALSNDDGGDGSNARISARLAPGTYTLTAEGYGGDRINGLYQIRVAARPLPEGGLREGGALDVGSTLTGLYEGNAHAYTFSLPARRVVRIDMRSDEIDPLMHLAGNGVEKTDDDGGDGLNARISMLLEPGDYTLRADAASAGAGLYTLAFAASEAPDNVGGGTLAAGRPIEATLLPGMTDRWTFNIRSAGEYAIAMHSDDVDSYLRLSRDGQEVATDDDGGGALNARIAQRLESGSYVVEASSVDGDTGGNYRISLERR
ncbi:ABC transporter substrate-binding protein [Luteimonas sp. 100069]|nr:ABC transporter substrate-binding protein [Luteimonas sp. 100069]